MKRKKVFLFLITILVILQYSPSDSIAAPPKVKDGDLLSIGYKLTVQATTIAEYTESYPLKFRILITFQPPGLYDAIIGMALGTNKDVTVLPEDGFSPLDEDYPQLAGQTLYYTNLKIYEINGYYYTDLPTSGINVPGTFGYYAIRVGLGLLGAAVFAGLVYGGYRLYPRFFGKKCLVCKELAIGTCVKCGKNFCERCYSNGCPSCKGRSLKRFKSSS